ncbi:MAG: ABC transporter substrate-binding protein [Burkholderiaceae bacterium]
MTTHNLPALRAEFAPTGTLRVGLNLSNFLLVNSASATGEPTGIAPDIGRELARRLGLPLAFVKYPAPGDLAAAASSGAWDIGLIGADPLRAGEIAFTTAYLEIEASYLVLEDSPIRRIEDVDRPGIRIAVGDKTAYDMYLRRTLKHATLHRAEGIEASYQLFLRERLDVLAGLKPRLVQDQGKHPGSRILEGRFTAIQQAIGTPLARKAAAAYLQDFVQQIKTGLVAELIDKHGVRGVSVAPP